MPWMNQRPRGSRAGGYIWPLGHLMGHKNVVLSWNTTYLTYLLQYGHETYNPVYRLLQDKALWSDPR